MEIGELIGLYLKKDGIDFTLCETGESGLEEFGRKKYELIVLDINLPGIDGFEFLQSIRKKSSIPVVIVSARETDEDIVLGLGIGADDFVTKPFSPKVLIARVRAHLRRAFDSRASIKKLIRFGSFALDEEGYRLEKEGERIPLPPREFEVLRYLLRNAGAARTLEQIYDFVWGNKYGDIATVAVHIQRIRKKIEKDPANPYFIETIHGLGYKFNPEAITEKM